MSCDGYASTKPGFATVRPRTVGTDITQASADSPKVCAVRLKDAWKRLVVCQLTALMLFVSGCSANREPMYQGVPASHWLERLTDKDDVVRTNAAFAVVQMRLSGPRAEEPLLTAMRDKSPRVRRHVAQALAECGPGVLAKLVTSLGDADARVRETAADALGHFGQLGESALPSLEPLLEDPAPEVQLTAAWSMLKINGKSARPLGVVVKQLSHESADIRQSAVQRLGDLKIADSTVSAGLVDALKDDSSLVRREAAFVLGELQEAQAVAHLISAMHDEDEQVRIAAAAAVPSLIELLRNDGRSVKASAAAALGEFGPAAAPAVADLVKLLADENPTVRKIAAESLGRIGDSAARSALLKAQRDGDIEVAKAATEALSRLRK